MKSILLLATAILMVLSGSCTRHVARESGAAGVSLIGSELRSEIRRIEKSVVGILADIDIEIQTFNYQLLDDLPIRDPNSPYGYKLLASDGAGIVTTTDEKALSGGGLLIDHTSDSDNYTILTSSHLVAPRDTTDVYFVDKEGRKTDILFQRHIVKRVRVSVRGRGNWRVKADVLAQDPVDDLALVVAETERQLAAEYPNEPGYDASPGWGDWVFMFGYPREVKQMTGGWVSKSPYRGTFATDAVVRFGFSGGPVFAISDDANKLVFVGVIKSVPSQTLEYIAPPEGLPPGFTLGPDDVPDLVVKAQNLVDYGTAYCVSPERIQAFVKNARASLRNAGIRLSAKYH